MQRFLKQHSFTPRLARKFTNTTLLSSLKHPPLGSSLADPFPTLFKTPSQTADPSDPNLSLRHDV
ncbi:hypothetical protein TrRE_jg12130, partial [Triparma retinervis]